jgi:undecaprenyl-diphosphatase
MSWPGVEKVDTRLDSFVAGWRGHPTVDALAYGASALGDHGLIWFLIGLARSRRPGRRRSLAVWAVSFTGVVAPVVNAGLKSAVGRGRPDPRPDDPPSIRTPRSASFPSGHTLAAWCAATLLADDDVLAPLYYAVAGTVSVSRVHLRHHHATDVLAGAAVGLGLGHLGRKLSPFRRTTPSR